MLMAYTLVVGWGLLGGSIAADRAYLLIALGSLVPAGAYLYGFLTSAPDRDLGLLLSAIGWLCAALALWVQHIAVQSVRAAAVPGELVVSTGTPAGTIFFSFLALAFLLAGSVLGFQNWTNSQEIRS
jgi:hypothetical protein